MLAQLARAAARRKISQLEEALEGAEFFTDEHAALLAKVLARTGRLSAGISARTTTSAGGTCAARSPTTSASSDPSASKSPSAASPNPARTEQPRTQSA